MLKILMLDGVPYLYAKEFFDFLSISPIKQEKYFPSFLFYEKPEVPMSYWYNEEGMAINKWHKIPRKFKNKFKLIPKKETSIKWDNFYDFDYDMHKYGFMRRPTIKKMKSMVNNTIKKNEWIIISDHGHFPVHTNLNPKKIFNLKGIDYFIGSIMIRFWGNENVINEVRKTANKYESFFVRNNPETGTSDRRINGDLWVECKNGYAFTNDFFTGKPYMSQHGYPNNNDLLKGFISSSENINPPSDIGDLIKWIKRRDTE